MTDIHSEARSALDEKATQLVGQLETSADDLNLEGKGFQPEHPVEATYTEEEILAPIVLSSEVPGLGEVSRHIQFEDERVGLNGDAFQEFLKLTESLHRAARLQNVVSLKTVRAHAFQWIVDSYRGGTGSGFCAYVSGKCSSLVKDVEVWAPIAGLSVQVPLRVGRVVLTPITPERIAAWKQELLSSKLQQDTVEAFAKKWRKKYQGCAAGVVSLRAERKHAEQMALKFTADALALLRFFHAASFSPWLLCGVLLYGQDNDAAETTIIRVMDDFVGESVGSVEPYAELWGLSAEEIQQIRSSGLDELSNLLASQRRSRFEEELLSSLLLYSKVSVSREVSDKLVYLFSSVESLLLKDSSEPIQGNIGARLAFLVGESLEERQDVIGVTKKVYDQRSKFLHHGASSENFEDLGKYMVYAWRAFLRLIHSRTRHPSKKELLEELQLRKLR